MEEDDLVEEALSCANEGRMALHGDLDPESGEDSESNGDYDLCASVGIQILFSFGSEGEMGRLTGNHLRGVAPLLQKLVVGLAAVRLINSHYRLESHRNSP